MGVKAEPATHVFLEASLSGDLQAREQLVELIYDDLRAVARGQMAKERKDHTLQPTALAHEAYLRLVGQGGTDEPSKTHFMALASMAVRRVLIDHARAAGAQKRGRGAHKQQISESAVVGESDPAPVLDLNAALVRLAQVEPRQAKVVELRFFGGLTLEETAAQLGVSRDTVKLDWRAARTWMQRELGDAAASF